jgi:FkbM family methyltransferase
MRGGWRLAASYVGLSEMHLPSVVRTRDGQSYRLEEYYDLETLWQIHVHHVYRLRSSDEVIIDAGANIGLFTCWAAARNPRATIVAVEPSQRNFERLLAHVRLNHFESRVRALPVALSATTGCVFLVERASASQMHHVAVSETAGAAARESLSLTDLMAGLPFERIDFLKMDIEGSEYGVLLSCPGDQLRRIRRLTVEYHLQEGTGWDKRALIQHLSHCGFSVVDRHPSADYGMIDAARDGVPGS